MAFICASSEVSRRLAPRAVAAGAVVIDDGSAFRMESNVPLVVPEAHRHVGGEELVVEEATEDSFEGVDVAFICASSEVSWTPPRRHSERAR